MYVWMIIYGHLSKKSEINFVFYVQNLEFLLTFNYDVNEWMVYNYMVMQMHELPRE